MINRGFMEIAVFQNYNDKTQSIFDPGIIKVYFKTLAEWKITKEIVFNIDNKGSLKAVREDIIKMAKNLGDCKVFVAKEIIGLPYTVLDGLGFNTWELDGTPKDFLEFVLEKEKLEAQTMGLKKVGEKLSLIHKVSDGNYFLNLKKIQEDNTNLTSKGILLPFLNTKTFYELQIICGHLPPWFEVEFKRLNLKAESEIINESEIKVRVYPKICKE